jgi:hypothetical protein
MFAVDGGCDADSFSTLREGYTREFFGEQCNCRGVAGAGAALRPPRILGEAF